MAYNERLRRVNSKKDLYQLRVGRGDGNVLVRARGLPRCQNLTIPLEHELLLQVDPQHVAVFPLLVGQVGQHGSGGLCAQKRLRLDGEELQSPAPVIPWWGA